MPNKTQLAQELAALEGPEWFAVLDEAKSARRERLQNELPDQDPKPGVTRDEFAHWIARRHLAADPGLRAVLYLPSNAPPNKVRLLEINMLLSLPDKPEPIEPFDFSPDIQGLSFVVLVADITPDQWQAIRDKKLALPDGWSLDGCVEIGHKV